jgi:hypothetical protein
MGGNPGERGSKYLLYGFASLFFEYFGRLAAAAEIRDEAAPKR